MDPAKAAKTTDLTKNSCCGTYWHQVSNAVNMIKLARDSELMICPTRLQQLIQRCSKEKKKKHFA